MMQHQAYTPKQMNGPPLPPYMSMHTANQNNKQSGPLLANPQAYPKVAGGRKGLLGDQPGVPDHSVIVENTQDYNDESDDNASTCSNGSYGSYKSGHFKIPANINVGVNMVKRGLLGDKPTVYKVESVAANTSFYSAGQASIQRSTASLPPSAPTSRNGAPRQYLTAVSRNSIKTNTQSRSSISIPSADVGAPSSQNISPGAVYNFTAYDAAAYQNQVYAAASLQAQQFQGQQVTANWNPAGGQLTDGLGYSAGSLGWDTNNVLAYQQMYQQYVAQQSLVPTYQLMGVAGQFRGQAAGAASQAVNPSMILPQVAAIPAHLETTANPPGTACITPIGHKRKAKSHLLPAPEASPEGIYVGQHSQGLGGHYADSYTKKRKLHSNF
jgi:hypothetical protein